MKLAIDQFKLLFEQESFSRFEDDYAMFGAIQKRTVLHLSLQFLNCDILNITMVGVGAWKKKQNFETMQMADVEEIILNFYAKWLMQRTRRRSVFLLPGSTSKTPRNRRD
jgi:hypothetical protein